MHIADPSTKKASWHIGHIQAINDAQTASCKACLPMTIYLTDTGFAVAQASSPILRRDDVGVTLTILPPNYFQ